MTRRSKISTSLSLGFLALLSLLSQFFSFRPIQDDYFILAALTEQSVASIIHSIWNYQGGNLLPYAVNSLLLASSLNSLEFIASRVFLLFTVALVIMVALVFLRLFGLNNRSFQLTYIAISLLAFEGIFTPLQIAAYSWHQTSVTHLWPVALTILAWQYSGSNKVTGFGIFLVGFAVGNSNSAEALWSIISTFFFLRTFLSRIDKKTKSKRIQLNIFMIASSFGLALTVVAPGFWNRANNSVGMPDSFFNLFYRFGKSVGAFSFDLLTHPILWLVFILGITCRSKFDKMGLLKISQIAKFLAKSSFLLYFILIIGTTIGYPAWHQALGLYVIFVPTIFLSGVVFTEHLDKHKNQVLKFLLFLTLVVNVVFSLRSTILVANRAHYWDIAYQSNICSIDQGIVDELIGAELIYPLFHKGIEDINRWHWMKEHYIEWISSQSSTIFDSCSRIIVSAETLEGS